MALVIRSLDVPHRALAEKVTSQELLSAHTATTDGRVEISILEISELGQLDITAQASELIWIQILSGAGAINDEPATTDHLFVIGTGAIMQFVSTTESRIFMARVPLASSYDPELPKNLFFQVDWSVEPVLNSEHDTRKRIYLASPELWGTDAVKGEMIIYPPGASGAEHHHIGAEHFQYIISGSGVAVLDGDEVTLKTGDLLYNFENEPHWFHNPHALEDMVFIEFFVPGESQTIWSPGVNACGWIPTGIDTKGRQAARKLEYHVHGEGKV